MKIRRFTELALLTALSLIIFVVELQIPNPFPIPGIKLGLANIVTVYAVYRYRAWETAAMVLVRVLLGALFAGSVTALIYSLSGAAVCLLGMLLLRRVIPDSRLWLSSMFGAVLHNTGQMAAALILLRTPGLLAYYPFLIVAGCLSGLFTGLCAQLIVKRLDNIRKKTGM